MKNTFDIKILEDGTLQIDSESFDDQKHMVADEFIDELEELLGTKRITKPKDNPFWKNREVRRGGKIVRTEV